MLLRMVSAFFGWDVLPRNPMSIFNVSTGMSRSRFREEYPLPKSSISTMNPYSLRCRMLEMLCAALFMTTVSVTSRWSFSGARPYFSTSCVKVS